MNDPSIALLEWAIDALGPIAEEVVLLGGCATGLLLTDPAAAPLRVTRDVDVIAAITTHSQYHQLCKRLRARGFREDTSDDALICRWRTADVTLDLIPTDPRVLGFGNVWHEAAYREAVRTKLPSGKALRHVTAPYFLATKLVAFDDRGKGDFMMSHDIEDLISVIDGRPEILEEIAQSNSELRRFLAKRFSELEASPRFIEAIPGHLSPDEASQARAPFILSRIHAITEIS